MKFTYQDTTKQRLDTWLSGQMPKLTRSQIKKLILSGLVTVNELSPSVHHWLKTGDKITYTAPVKLKPAEMLLEPKIIDQTADYLVLEKPSGLLVHPTDKGEINTLANWLIKNFPKIKKVGDSPSRPGIVHRLDKEVSGLMVVALTQKFFDSIKNQFQERTIQKEYTTLVHGRLINEAGQINTPLERDKKTGLMKVQSSLMTGSPSFTTYEVIKKFINFTLVKVRIYTGRTHQIRAHFYSIGHSVVGDKLYQTKDIRKKKKVLDTQIFLHADYLKFQDASGSWHSYRSILPKELKNFLKTAK